MGDYYRFRVQLLDVPAELWRRFLLRSDRTFFNLHRAIQDACGWQDCHLFEFLTSDGREVIAGIPNDEWGPPAPDAERIKLASVFAGETPHACLYHYDFGDDWHHEVTLEGVEKIPQRFSRRFLGGEGAFPPEDCGGTLGYVRCVAAVTGSGWRKEFGGQTERDELLQWMGDWRPDAVDLQVVKRRFDR